MAAKSSALPALAILATAFHAGSAAAQSCPALDFTGLDSDQSACVSNCCSSFNSCYSANSCTLDKDWPKGVASSCEICNQAYFSCTGFCLVVPEFRQSYLNLQSASGCTATCGLQSPIDPALCGVTDGCGGTCTSDDYCGLFVRRPELITAIF